MSPLICGSGSPSAAAKHTTTIAIHLGRSLAEVAHSTEVPVQLRWIILREVVPSVLGDMHQTIDIIDRHSQRTGPCSMNAAVCIVSC